MNAHEKKIKDILNGARLLEIPYYQRSYVWNEELWKRFLEDVIDLTLPSAKPHFFGSIILKQQQTPAMGGVSDIRTVIDGQQRLTTIAIFFKVLSLKLGQDWIFEDVCKCRSIINGKSTMVLAFCHNRLDRPAFERIMNLTSLENLSVDKNGNVVESDSQIINAYQYFLREIDTTILDINSVAPILDKILLVGIDLTYDEDEQQIFDTINSLGIKLTTSELLKNYLFNENNLNEFKAYWEPIFEKDREYKEYWDQEIVSGTSRPHLIDVFFSALLNMKVHDAKYRVTTEDKLRYARTEKLFESYKEFISKYMGGDKNTLMKEINEYATLFKENLKPDCGEDALTEEVGLDRLNVMMFSLKMSTMIPYILYLLVNQKDKNEITKICEYLEAYMMRRLICHVDTRSYNKMYSDSLLTNSILTLKDLQEFVNGKDSDRLTAPVDDVDIQKAINGGVYLINEQNTGILYMLETRLRSDSYSATVMKGIKYYTLEHLMPKKWKQTWGMTGLNDATIQNRDDILYTLGNLAIIPGKLNTSISNSKWQDKLNGKGNKPGLIKAASGLITLDKYLKITDWDENEITKRANDLYVQILKVWKK